MAVLGWNSMHCRYWLTDGAAFGELILLCKWPLFKAHPLHNNRGRGHTNLFLVIRIGARQHQP
eukprot:7836389-Prorocentrum_lima.AAC.1